MQIQLIKINIFIVLLVQFLLLQWFLASQKSIFLGFIIVVASVIAFNRMLKEWIFTVLPTVWLFGNLAVLYFFPNQFVVLVAVGGYFGIFLLAAKAQYSFWQAASILNIYLLTSLIWFFILAQALDFILGLIFISVGTGLLFFQSMLITRRAGEFVNIKNKIQITTVSLGVSMGLAETAWAISFLPFGYFILGALFTVVFGAVLNIISSYYKVSSTDPETFKKIVTRSVILAFVFIIIFVTISPWLPQK